MLAPPGSQPGLRAKIPAGYRAVSISVTEESAVAGFVMPGSRVDVYGGGGNGSARLILSDVEVGAVGQSLSEVGKDGRTVRITKSVTLFLKPEEIQMLHASAGGRKSKGLRLALRGNSEQKKNGDASFWSRVMASALEKSLQQPVAQEPSNDVFVAASNRHVVDVVRGSEVERLVFVEAAIPGEYRTLDELSDDNIGGTGFGTTVVPSEMEMLE
jgi:Flp pilus assembly protein CpaB